MDAPDSTYRYAYPKDIAGQTFETLSRAVSNTATAAVRTFTFVDLSKDKVLVLTNVSVDGDPGAGQNVVSLRVEGFTAALLGFTIAVVIPPGTADVTEELNWQGAVYLPGGGDGTTQVQIAVVFNAGIASNALRASLHGIIIPRGNVAQF